MKKRRIKKWIKKGIVLLLCAAMPVGMVPKMSFAPEKVWAAAEQPKIFKTGTYTLKDVEITGGTGQSAVVVSGNVTLKIEGTVKLTGGAGAAGKGGGAGIEVPQGSSLTLSGSGTLYAKGGNAGNGANGELAGRGGGGAGAGIGSRGADNAASSNAAGTVTIKDKDLLVEARGGGSGTGGSGAEGRVSGGIIEYSISQFSTTMKIQGGSGGNGGGGGGYAAAGIGSGGAAGGNGGAGGAGSTDSTKCTVVPIITSAWTCVVKPGWCQATGGGGGGGGAGAQSGGGGGAGGVLYGNLDTEGKSYKTTTIVWTDESVKATDLYGSSGGSPGQDGSNPKKESFTYNGNKATSGKGGTAAYQYIGGSGGAGGTALNGKASAQAGGTGQNAGKRSSAGSITLAGGTVYAYGGGGAAQNIGSGDGLGNASGSLVIRGGNLPKNGNVNGSGSMLSPTNGQKAVYPAEVSPYRYTSSDQNCSAGVTVNGVDWQVSRFGSASDGKITLWLPESGSAYAVTINEPIKSDYKVEVKNKKATVTATGEVPDLVVDLKDGDLTLNEKTYSQGGNSGVLSGNSIYITGGAGEKRNITCAKNTNHKLILQNAQINSLKVSGSPNDPATLTLECIGNNNNISEVYIQNKNSQLILEGDAESRLNIGKIANPKNSKIYYTYTGAYISDVAIGTGETEAAAKKQLTDRGYEVINCDLNKNAQGRWIFLGIKTAFGSENAIRGLATYNKLINDGIDDTQIKGYKPVTCYGGNGDLNEKAGGEDIYLYYTKDKTAGDPLTGIQVLTTSNANTAPNYCTTCCDDTVHRLKKQGKADYTKYGMDMNAGAGGDYIYIATGKSDWADESAEYYSTGPTEQYRQGSVVMNSKGIVHFDYFRGNWTGGCESDEYYFYGTASMQVNSGCLQIDSYMDLATTGYYMFHIYTWVPAVGSYQRFPVQTTSWDTTKAHWWIHGAYRAGSALDDIYYRSGSAKCVTWGSNTLGNITVNGGTLQFGADGQGKITQPGRMTGVFSVDFSRQIITQPIVNVASGGNLLSSDFSSYLASSDKGKKLELTGLAPDSHMSLIMRTDKDAMIGDYENQDIWTNENGNFITYLRAGNDNGKQLVFADGEGYAYVYKMQASASKVSAEKVTLQKLSTVALGTDLLRLHPHYAVQKDQVYGYDEDKEGQKPVYILKQDVETEVLLADNVDITLKTEGHHSMNNVTGVGSLTLDQADLEVKGEFNVSSLEVMSGTLTASGITGEISVKGGSVKTDKPIMGATGQGNVPVYQAVIPAWPEDGTEVSVDGISWNVSGSGHGDGNTYLYVPQDARDVFINGRCFRLSFNSETQTMDVRERLNGDGKIDLTQGSAEILNDNEYIWNGQLYLNTNEEGYEVTGNSDENTLTVLASDKIPQITLKDISLNNKESPVRVAEGIKAQILLEGTNTLTGGDSYPAIHVPEGAEVSIGGYGILNAGGGVGAAAVGGAFGEVNGTIRINGGTWNLTTLNNPAVGAGAGADTTKGSLIVTGGSVKTEGDDDVFAVTPVNEENAVLSRVVINDVSEGQVLVNEKDFHVKTPNDDGKLYLYLVSDTYTIQAGTDEYMLVPLNLAEAKNGQISLWLEASDGTETRLSSGDMVLEGSDIRIHTQPDERYALRTGPDTGNYRVERENDVLVLKPVYGFSGIVVGDWEVEIESDEDSKYNELKEYRRNMEKDEPVTVDVGKARQGDAVLAFTAAGSGIQVEILVDGAVVKTVTLEEESRDFTYEWESDGTEAVALRFSGEGKTTLSSAFLSNKIEVSQVGAEFGKEYTIFLNQPGKDEYDDCLGALELLDENDKQITDNDLGSQGIQVLDGQYVKVRYWDPDGGSFFDRFILKDKNENAVTKYENGDKIPLTENLLTFTMGTDIKQDVTISAESHLDTYYEVVLPESVAMSDEGAETKITAVKMQKMEKGASVQVSIDGLDENGNAVLKRKGDETTTLSVPVKDGNDNSLENESVVALFQRNTLEPEGGTIHFGAPDLSGSDSGGRKKAGTYEGKITFVIKYNKQ